MKYFKWGKLSFPMWFGLAMIFLVALIVRLFVDSFSISDILKELIEELCLVLISISIFEFLYSISNERVLINDIVEQIQLKISKDTDFSMMSNEAKKEIEKNIIEQTMLKKMHENIYYDGSNDSDIRNMAEAISSDFIKKISKNTYFKNFNRDIEIILHENDVEVKTTNVFHIVNPTKEKFEFKHNPLFRTKKEFFSYELIDPIYNEKPLNKKNIHFSDTPIKSESNSLCIAGKKIVIDMSKEINHHLKFTSSYRINYNMFFQTYWFNCFCEQFTLNATISDKRKSKDGTFVIRWAMFGNSWRKSRISPSDMKQEDHSIHIMRAREWLQEGSGYALTICEKCSSDSI